MTLVNQSRRLTLWGTVLIGLVALIHLLVIPEYFEVATYLGLLFVADFLLAAASTAGIYLRAWWGWPLGAVISAGSFIMYIESRTIGLPRLHEGWLDPPGVLSLIVEAAFLIVFFTSARSSR